MKQVMVMEFANYISINELNHIMNKIYTEHRHAIKDSYPVNMVE